MFVTVEGVEGAGKSTLLGLLAGEFERQISVLYLCGYDKVQCAEYGSCGPSSFRHGSRLCPEPSDPGELLRWEIC